jgi:phage shock protein E
MDVNKSIVGTRKGVWDNVKSQIKPVTSIDSIKPTIVQLSCDELSEVLKIKGMILDVRSPALFAGHKIHRARNIPLQHVVKESYAWDKTTPILVYCATGQQAQTAKERLEDVGFQNVTNIGHVGLYPHCS